MSATSPSRSSSSSSSSSDQVSKKERKKERLPETSYTVSVKIGNRELYDAWVRTIPRKGIGRRFEELMAKDLAESASAGKIVLNQSLTNFIVANDQSHVTVNNTVQISEKDWKIRLELWARTKPGQRKQWVDYLVQHPELQGLPSAKELMRRWEAEP